MHEPPATEESHQIEALTQAVEELRRRVTALEHAAAGANIAPQRAPAALSFTEPPSSSLPSTELADVSPGIMSALGRLLLGIAGAYLLRAITETGIIPQLAGTSLGLLYAAGWLISSARISSGHRLSVAMHGATAACIVAPLLWEATVRFHTMSAAASAFVLALFIVLGQIFAWRLDHSALAGVTSFAGAATGLALTIATLDPVPFAIALAVAAAVVEFGAWRGRALTWRWIAALAYDLCTALLLYLITRREGIPEGYAAIPVAAVGTLLVALVATYVTSTVLRTLARGIAITCFEVFEIALAAALVIGGGLRIVHSTGPLPVLIATTCLLLGAACYFAAFTGLAAGRNFHAYSTFGLSLILIGGSLSSKAPMLWILSALIAIALAATQQRNTAAMHSAIYLIAAAWTSGLLINSAAALTGATIVGAHRPSTASLLCIMVAAIAFGVLLQTRKLRLIAWTEQVPSALIAALLSWALAGLGCAAVFRIQIAPGFSSTVRTTVLSIVAIILAWFGNRKGCRELTWILFPWMLFGAGKLFAEEFQQGRPATLFLSLLVYGGTLIVLPRLLRRDSRPT